MKVDPELMMECLIYLNGYYYGVFATCDIIMVVSKYFSIRSTPNIYEDGAVSLTRVIGELAKILMFYKLKDKKMKLATAFVILMTLVSVATVFYTVMYQDPVLKLEKVLASLTIMLAVTEILFGVMCYLPCFKPVTYY